VFGVFRPVHRRANVVADVVAVVPALVVVLVVDASDGVLVVVARIGVVNKGVLGPVAEHHNEAADEKGQNEHKQRGLPIDKTQRDTEQVKESFTAHHFRDQGWAVVASEIAYSAVQPEQQKVAEIAQPIAETVPLVLHSAAFVFGQVVFGVVHAHVVRSVGLRCLTEKRADDPRQVMVKKFVFFFKEFTMAGAVQHQAERTLEDKVVHQGVANCHDCKKPNRQARDVHGHPDQHHKKGNLQGQVHKGQVALVADQVEHETVNRAVLRFG